MTCLQGSQLLFSTSELRIDLADLPFQPARSGTISIELRDVIGAALTLIFNPHCSGASVSVCYLFLSIPVEFVSILFICREKR